MIADPDLYLFFLDCHNKLEYHNGVLLRRIKTCNRIVVGKTAGYKSSSTGYWKVSVNNKEHSAHRIVFFMFRGYFPEQVDHINCVRDDNRIENLRAATQEENQRNVKARATNKSGVKGVYWNKDAHKWAASCRANGKYHHLGYFLNIEDAAAIVQQFRNQHHGGFTNHG